MAWGDADPPIRAFWRSVPPCRRQLLPLKGIRAVNGMAEGGSSASRTFATAGMNGLMFVTSAKPSFGATTLAMRGAPMRELA